MFETKGSYIGETRPLGVFFLRLKFLDFEINENDKFSVKGNILNSIFKQIKTEIGKTKLETCMGQ